MNESNANDQGATERPASEPAEASESHAPIEPAVSGDDYVIAEPQLDTAAISEDVAQTVDLKAAEAEAARVEHEAELAAQSVSSPSAAAAAKDTGGNGTATVMPTDLPKDPVAANPRPTQANAAGVAEPEAPIDQQQTPADDSPAPASAGTEVPPPPAAPQLGSHSVNDGHGWRRPETPWQPKAGGWQSPAQMERGRTDAAALAAANEPAGQHSGGQAPEQGVPPTTEPSYGTPAQYGAVSVAATSNPGTPGVPPVPGYPGAPDYRGGPGGPSYPDGPRNAANPEGTDNGGDSGNNKKKLFIILGVVVLGLGLVILFAWLLLNFIFSNLGKDTAGSDPINTQSQPTSSSAGTEPTDGAALSGDKVIVAGLTPLDWLGEDCLRNFTDASSPADVVLCSSPHNAQLVGTYYYGEQEEFPGVDALKAKAAEVCDGVELTSDASSMASLQQTTAYPSESTWNDSDDRRVDCLVHDTREGNSLVDSLLM